MTQMSSQSVPPQGSSKLLLVAVVLAIVAAVMVNVYGEMLKRANAEQSFPVYRLTRSMKRGEKLRRQDVRMFAVPVSFRDSFPDAVDTEAALENLLESEPLQMDVPQNAVLLRSHFVERGGEAGDRNITLGYRRVWLPVNSRSVPGGLAPGMYVDIAAPFSTGAGLPEVKLVMERVKVEAVGERTISDDTVGVQRSRSYHGITIDLPPGDALKLSQISMMITGDFILQLRNPGDNERTIKSGGINPEIDQLIEQRRRLPATAGP